MFKGTAKITFSKVNMPSWIWSLMELTQFRQLQIQEKTISRDSTTFCACHASCHANYLHSNMSCSFKFPSGHSFHNTPQVLVCCIFIMLQFKMLSNFQEIAFLMHGLHRNWNCVAWFPNISKFSGFLFAVVILLNSTLDRTILVDFDSLSFVKVAFMV